MALRWVERLVQVQQALGLPMEPQGLLVQLGQEPSALGRGRQASLRREPQGKPEQQEQELRLALALL